MGGPPLSPPGPVRARWLAWVEVIQLLAAARADGRGQHINWPRVEMLSRFGGIRIEDDWRSRAQGARNLTRAAFDSLQ
jgi:hypothetical protein